MGFVLKVGSKGELVSELQQKLVKNGVLQETIDGMPTADGVFGLVTRMAVLDFQRKNKLTEDGIVGQKTAKSLDLNLPAVDVHHGPAQVFTEKQLSRLAEIIDGLIPTGPADIFDGPAIAWIVKKIDHFIASILPPSILLYANDITKGIDGADFSAIKSRISKGINSHINIPLLTEETEGQIIDFVVGTIVDSIQIGSKFDKAIEKIAASKANR